MKTPKLIVTKENSTGRNLVFQVTSNHQSTTNPDLIRRLKKGNSAYNSDYYVNRDKNGKEYVASKPDGKEENNLG